MGLSMDWKLQTEFSQLDMTACIKSCVYNNFNFRCYFMSWIIERLQISIL